MRTAGSQSVAWLGVNLGDTAFSLTRWSEVLTSPKVRTLVVVSYKTTVILCPPGCCHSTTTLHLDVFVKGGVPVSRTPGLDLLRWPRACST